MRHIGITGLLDELTGPDFIILTDGVVADTAFDDDQWAFLDEIDATVVALTEDGRFGTWADIENAYLPQLRAQSHIAAIVRPDFYLFGTASTPAELGELVDQLRTRLQQTATS